jgi:hypothetical protein
MKRGLVLLSLVALPAASLEAQVTADFTPRMGVYIPLENLTVGVDPTTGLPQRQKAETKFTIGSRLGVWFGPTFGLEGVVDYNKSGVTTYLGGVPTTPTAGSHIFAASGRAMLKLHVADNNFAVILNGGAGILDRGGEYINGINPPSTTYTGRTDFAPAAGISFLIRLKKDVAGRIDVDGYTYQAQFSNPIFGTTGQQRQYDLVIMFGLTGPFKNYGIPGDRDW